MPTNVNDKLISWASDIDPGTIRQAEKTARLPIVDGHVALMPDAHIGIGATVGSVIPTKGAVIPAAVGVDIGCGMVAAELDVTEEQLSDDLEPLLGRIAKAIPAGVGQGHDVAARNANVWLDQHKPATELADKQAAKVTKQFGTLGSGNHFFELCIDERSRVWVVLHSGSRGIGNQLAQMHIAKARRLAKDLQLRLEDPDLAYFMEGTPEFQAYIGDMLWAQDYARANRDQMMDNAMREVFAFIGHGRETQRINCHHNFTQREVHNGAELWITRKGAMALVRNLRNFDQAGISESAIEAVIAKVTDAEQVAKAQLFPYKVWAAHKNAPSDNWRRALGRTLEHTVANIPALDGTLVVIDTSGSMQATVSGRSTMQRVEVAAVMAMATAKRASNVDVVIYGQTNALVRKLAGMSVLGGVDKVVRSVNSVGHATYGHTAIARWYDPTRHRRAVIFTDDQQHDSGHVRLDHVPLIYTFNLAGYRPSALPAGERNRYTIGGFTDATFTVMKVLEGGRNATWPF